MGVGGCGQGVAALTVLSEASGLVDGDRQEAYGHPSVNHQCTADMWNAYLRRRGFDVTITARDVCWLNALQKASRDANSPQRDNLVDVCGFMRNAEMVDE